MHNPTFLQIVTLARRIAELNENNSSELLELSRELYEKVILFTHKQKEEAQLDVDNNKTVEMEVEKKSTKKNDAIENKQKEVIEEELVDESKLSIQERIRRIMENTPATNQSNKHESASIPEKAPEIITEKPAKNEIVTPEEKIELPKTNVTDEFKDAISADFATELFEKAEKIEITKKSLNDKLSQNHIQIGLNDRIAFVKHLFNGSQADFNRVLSQLNSFDSEETAKNFLENRVKPEYNWTDKEEYEIRFITLIERRFL